MWSFDYARIPPIFFGAGKLIRLPQLVTQFQGQVVLLVTGGTSLQRSGKLAWVKNLLEQSGMTVHHVACDAEPTVTLIDGVVTSYRTLSVDVVISIGGGSVVDAGKAISAMLPHDNSIIDHLEGVGRGVAHSGVKKPFIAVPTTSGTGSEVTKNAVISEVGVAGYKKSIRHDNFIADGVIVDGELLTSCPRDVTAACAMDAFTQLLEPFLSPTVSPLTEAIAWSGLEALKDSLLPACGTAAADVTVRERLAYASLLSGIALANDGLGIVHGLASPIGGFFPIPHGVVCATLVASSVRANLRALRQRAPTSPALKKLARVGALVVGPSELSADDSCDALVDTLDQWTTILQVPKLSQYGINDHDLEKILDLAENRNNPIELTRAEIRSLLEERL
ncbi:MAG: iron-containing alcohol dehydrogenase [Gammaproteobacteria bacterium]